MRFAATLLLGLALAATLPQIVSAEPDVARPTWRLQVRAYGPEGSSVVGLHHRAGKSAEIGLSFGGSIRDTNRDEGESYDVTNDDSSVAFHLRPEYRRWSMKRESVSTFWAFNFMFGYERSDRRLESGTMTQTSKTESPVLGAGFSLGADVVLLKHVSATMIITPFDLRHYWTEYKQTREAAGSEAVKGRRRETRLEAAFNLSPALYATVRF